MHSHTPFLWTILKDFVLKKKCISFCMPAESTEAVFWYLLSVSLVNMLQCSGMALSSDYLLVTLGDWLLTIPVFSLILALNFPLETIKVPSPVLLWLCSS